MKIELSLEQIQRQKIAITPKLKQTLSLLQYPVQDLLSFLEKEAEQNPLLEVEEPDVFKEKRIQTEIDSVDEEESFLRDSDAYEESYDQPFIHSVETYASNEVTLQQYLLEQIKFMQLNESERKVLAFMVGNLDEQGYLDLDGEQVLREGWCSPETWERCLALLHQLEPYGVGARNLSECLLIQLKHSRYAEDEICHHLIKHHLQAIAQHRYEELAKRFQVDVDEILSRVRLIQSFHPKPGYLFNVQKPRYVVPDVIVTRQSDGTWVIKANEAALPRIGLNPTYAALLRENGPAQPFLRQKHRELLWIIRGIRKRVKTILKVAEVIMQRQALFFEQKEGTLLPLTMRDVAQELGLHESTISRAVNGKYMQTPWGVYELRYFFQRGLEGNFGGTVTEFTVKRLIQQIIEAEDGHNPYSDQAIVRQLAERGIPIARRTVAKYRNELGIPSSAVRKKTKASFINRPKA